MSALSKLQVGVQDGKQRYHWLKMRFALRGSTVATCQPGSGGRRCAHVRCKRCAQPSDGALAPAAARTLAPAQVPVKLTLAQSDNVSAAPIKPAYVSAWRRPNAHALAADPKGSAFWPRRAPPAARVCSRRRRHARTPASLTACTPQFGPFPAADGVPGVIPGSPC